MLPVSSGVKRVEASLVRNSSYHRICGSIPSQQDTQCVPFDGRRCLIFGIEKLSHFEAGQRDTRKRKGKKKREEGKACSLKNGKR